MTEAEITALVEEKARLARENGRLRAVLQWIADRDSWARRLAVADGPSTLAVDMAGRAAEALRDGHPPAEAR